MALEFRQRWRFTSSGVGAAINAFGQGDQWTGYYTTDAASSAAVQLEASPQSAGPFGIIPGTSTTVNTNATAIVQFAGPHLWVRPHLTTFGGTSATIELLGMDSE